MSEREVYPQAGSWESIAGMIRQLTHEARNALQHSQAALERLRWKVADQPEALAQLALAQGAQEDMVRLCEAAHVCTAPLTLHRDWHDVGEIWWEAAARGVAQAGRVQVVDRLGGISRRCEVDRARLIQAFRYLLGYAAGTATGPVVLTVTAEDCRLADRPALQFGIRLDRPAPPAADREGFFDAFDSERPRKHQLSLAAAYKIIQAHEGRLSLDAGPKMGLALQLPRSSS